MKGSITKMLMVGALTMLCSGAALANWQCTATNARNQTWVGIGISRAAASATVMRICANNSTYAKNCQINRCITTTSTTMPPSGGWQCRSTNAKGQIWVGIGNTRSAAAATSISFCARNSTYSRNCQIQGCSPRY
jgi:hypothetical protein